MVLSRERANDLSRRVAERLRKTPGVEVLAEAEFLRNRLLFAVLEWDRELARITERARGRVAARGRRVAEGSREWDLLLSEEMERAFGDLVGRGE